MDKIILGILMMNGMTAYEIRMTIRSYFQSMCSDSLGSIQTVLKKLLSQKLVTCEELVENGVNKKKYSITDAGCESLLDWLRVPIDVSKTKNIDFGKLLFMGYVPQEERLALIDETIVSIGVELNELRDIKETVLQSGEKEQVASYLKESKKVTEMLNKHTKMTSISEMVESIAYFEMAALKLGIENLEFYLEWFSKLREEVLNQSS
ncbi:MAG: PadR family transcriptional regulator [Peptostreptococcaceae bacterium]|nr:PadR family transcriptional regulator [Peptostreptococcaceae bacterium]